MDVTGNVFYFEWEAKLIEWLQTHLGSGLISVLSYFSILGEATLIVLILGFIYWSYNKKLGRTMILTVLSACTWSAMIKNIALRRRPYFDNKDIKVLRPVEPDADLYDIQAQGFSFPSTHSANAAGLFGSLAYGIRKKWTMILAILLPLMTGLSRVVVGVHYPTDVAAGWLLGILAVFLIPYLEKKIENKALLYGILLVLTLPGLIYCRSEDYFTSAGLLTGFMAASLFEEQLVNFEDPRSVPEMVLRLVIGVAIYFVLNTLLKLPFRKEFLEGGSYAALLVRYFRYMVIVFLDFGVYPMSFRLVNKKSGLRPNIR